MKLAILHKIFDLSKTGSEVLVCALTDPYIRSMLKKLRSGMAQFQIELGRWRGVNRSDIGSVVLVILRTLVTGCLALHGILNANH